MGLRTCKAGICRQFKQTVPECRASKQGGIPMKELDDLNYSAKINCKDELTQIKEYNELNEKMLLAEGD